MSDEWIVQFGGVFVELEEIKEKIIRKKKSVHKMIYFTKILQAKAFFKNTLSLFLHHENTTCDQHL